MSKELTEQWRAGTLDAGWYYLEFENGSTLPVYYCGFNKEFELRWDWKISKVLAHYISFADLCELKQDLEICKEAKADLYAKLCNALMQLEEANGLIGTIGCQTNNEDLKKCIDYCKKWGVK